MTIQELMRLALERQASDLHLVAGIPPNLRVDGVLFPIPGETVLTNDVLDSYIREILTSEQYAKVAKNKELDLSLSFEKARFRVNVYVQRGTWAVALRRIPLEIPTIDTLNLPKVLHQIADLHQGLVLVTGPTGHGKSSTLAAVINEINTHRAEHILTIEDPIEFLFAPIKSVITQREMGKDTYSWSNALKSALREDPDVVLVGEMRDLETISATLTVAETGHLVFATLHTNSAAQTIDRIVDVFPEEQQDQVRLQVSNVLEAVFSQRLVPGISQGRFPAYELMLGTTAVANAIRESKTHQIDSIIQTSSEAGMKTLDASLAELVKKGAITVENAQKFSLRPDELTRLIAK